MLLRREKRTAASLLQHVNILLVRLTFWLISDIHSRLHCYRLYPSRSYQEGQIEVLLSMHSPVHSINTSTAYRLLVCNKDRSRTILAGANNLSQGVRPTDYPPNATSKASPFVRLLKRASQKTAGSDSNNGRLTPCTALSLPRER